MEDSLRRSVRPKVININSAGGGTTNMAGRESVAPFKSVISPVQSNPLYKSTITPSASFSEAKRRQGSGTSSLQGASSSRTVIKDPLPQRVHQLENYFIEKVVCGSDQTFVITAPSENDPRHCFSWGCNSHAQLGHSWEARNDQTSAVSNQSSMQKVQSPTLIEALDQSNITHIACGNSHALAWSSERQEDQVVFGWGNGCNGRLGNESDEVVPTPQVLECFRQGTQMGLLQTKSIACGENHSLALVDVDMAQVDGDEAGEQEEIKREDQVAQQQQQGGKVTRLFVWGCNEKQQLGLNSDIFDDIGTDEANSNGARSGPASSNNTTSQDVKVPHQLEPCPFEAHEDGQVPLQIEAGYNYSGAVTTDGVIYTWGNGSFGRLGYVDILKQSVPRQVTELKAHKITRLALGYYHAAAINQEGLLFSWGRGNSGQLGCGNVLNEDQVKPINALANHFILDVHCGESHTVALTSEGEVYTWGGGSMGQLGLGDFLRQSLPIKVSNMEAKVIKISCGKRHTAAISESGALYTWGSNEYGQLGRQASVKLYLKKQNVSSGMSTSIGQNITSSAKTSPSMNLIQTTYQFYNKHKIPLSTDNQATMKGFEFPIANSGTSEDDESTNFNRLNKMAAESVSLNQSLSPHQTFTPLNKLQEVSPYNAKDKIVRNVPKLELDSNSDSANQYYKHSLGQHGPQTSQGYMPVRNGFPVNQQQPQPQSATHQHNSNMFGSSMMYHHAQDVSQMQHAQTAQKHFSGGQHSGDGQMTPMTPGQQSYLRNMQQDQTPKYIKNLRAELNVALKKNLELSRKLENKEEELESDVQNQVISIGEKFSQKIKKSEKTAQIDQATNQAFEELDALQGQQNLIRFVKSNLESTGSLRKEVILQAALIHSLESQATLQKLQQQQQQSPH